MRGFDWKKYATVKFKPKTVRSNQIGARGSCGTYALHCLTGVEIREIEKHCPKKGWWDDRAMRLFLKKHGYQTIPLNENLIHKSKPYQYRENINHQHILLISLHSSDSEGTWEVVHNNRAYHGHEVEFFSGYELMINPLWTAYLVWHPKWRSSESMKLNQCKGYWVTHKLDGYIFHPMTGGWFNPETNKIETPPSSRIKHHPDHSYGSGKPRRARRRDRS